MLVYHAEEMMGRKREQTVGAGPDLGIDGVQDLDCHGFEAQQRQATQALRGAVRQYCKEVKQLR